MYYCAMEKQKHVFYSTSGHYIIAKIYYSAAILYTIYIYIIKSIFSQNIIHILCTIYNLPTHLCPSILIYSVNYRYK